METPRPSVAYTAATVLKQAADRSARLAHWRRWQGRVVLALGAIALAVAILVFSSLVDAGTERFITLRVAMPWLPLLLTPAGGVLVVYLTRRFFPGAAGSGIPQTIAALKPQRDDSARRGLVSLRLAIGKIGLGSLALLCGFASGKEGPSVQIGASIMQACNRFLPERLHIRGEQLLLAGGAAGIAVAFNTPLAGIVFAIEELGRRFDRRSNVILLTTIIVACAVSIGWRGNSSYFGRLAITATGHQLLLPILVTGLAGGVFGGLFSRVMVHASHPHRSLLGRLRSAHPLWFAGACGLGVALLGVFSDGLAFGGGYHVTRAALEGGHVMPATYPLYKSVATLLSYFSGIPGGIFAPSLAIGAGLGQDLQTLAPAYGTPGEWVALGMAGFLAGVTQVPVTTFVIVMEMIDGHSMVLSLIATALLAHLVSRIFSHSLYHSLARQYPNTPHQG
ncbi:MAG TPA: chloride channel protein [Moraxellaceae bacterium]|nr:chloride channel protein [Moraxellaceae bacterium]